MSSSLHKQLQELKSKKANTLIIVVLFIPILLIIIGMTIDGGMMFVRKAELQLIADNAATAGISTISDEIPSPIQTASSYIRKNNTKNLKLSQNIFYPHNFTPGDNTISIKIVISTDQPLYFTTILGINSQTITAQAISSIKIR